MFCVSIALLQPLWMSFVRCMLKFELNDFFCLYLVELIVFVFIYIDAYPSLEGKTLIRLYLVELIVFVFTYIDAYPSLEGKTLIRLNALPVYHRM